ncbi:hypothetical protein RJT34_13522 [Clitoria ternatea]|uniref:Uncharacterized protein n=1 Tax=Clitoria ternatea TaxID=43366 RepID=A0AAN9PK96_CLITE
MRSVFYHIFLRNIQKQLNHNVAYYSLINSYRSKEYGKTKLSTWDNMFVEISQQLQQWNSMDCQSSWLLSWGIIWQFLHKASFFKPHFQTYRKIPTLNPCEPPFALLGSLPSPHSISNTHEQAGHKLGIMEAQLVTQN